MSAKKILLIEDSKDLTMAMEGILELEGYEIIIAHDGVKGIEEARRHKPNLILLDLMLPKISGYEVCKILKTDNNTWRIPIVIISTLTKPHQIDKAREVGADHFIAKPYNLDEIVREVKKYIR